jgi:hypothetical protein
VVQCLDRHVPDIAEACAPVQAPVLLEASGPSSTASMAKLADSSSANLPPQGPPPLRCCRFWSRTTLGYELARRGREQREGWA